MRFSHRMSDEFSKFFCVSTPNSFRLLHQLCFALVIYDQEENKYPRRNRHVKSMLPVSRAWEGRGGRIGSIRAQLRQFCSVRHPAACDGVPSIICLSMHARMRPTRIFSRLSLYSLVYVCCSVYVQYRHLFRLRKSNSPQNVPSRQERYAEPPPVCLVSKANNGWLATQTNSGACFHLLNQFPISFDSKFSHRTKWYIGCAIYYNKQVGWRNMSWPFIKSNLQLRMPYYKPTVVQDKIVH